MDALRKTSGWLPLAMSAAAFALVLGYVGFVGVAEEPPHDEQAPARLFQLLLVGQLPIVGYFAVRWLPRMPARALAVLALQCVAGLGAVGLVAVLER